MFQNDWELLKPLFFRNRVGSACHVCFARPLPSVSRVLKADDVLMAMIHWQKLECIQVVRCVWQRLGVQSYDKIECGSSSCLSNVYALPTIDN